MIDLFHQNASLLREYLSLDQPFDIVQGCIWEEAENKRKINTNMQIDELIKKSGGKKSKNKKIVKIAYGKSNSHI